MVLLTISVSLLYYGSLIMIVVRSCDAFAKLQLYGKFYSLSLLKQQQFHVLTVAAFCATSCTFCEQGLDIGRTKRSKHNFALRLLYCNTGRYPTGQNRWVRLLP